MDKVNYKQLVAQLDGLTDAQVEELAGILEQRRDMNGVARLVAAKMAEQSRCPHCQGQHVVKNGTSRGSARFLCRGCGKTFTTLTGTPLHRLRDKEKFLEHAACMADGLSIRKTAARLGFTVNKTFRWRHKFLSFLSQQKPQAMTGRGRNGRNLFPLVVQGATQGPSASHPAAQREEERRRGPCGR